VKCGARRTGSSGSTPNDGATVTDPIRIDDLRDPHLDAGQRAALDYVATLDIRFDADAMMATARERAQSDNFGDPAFRVRLDAMIDAVEADTGLGPLGRLAIHQRTIRLLTGRLLVEDLVRRRPEILAIELPAPIIVIGRLCAPFRSRLVGACR